MIQRIVILLMVIMATGCASRSVNIDSDIEQIPREIALDYLQTESTVFSPNFKCLYTKFGVGDIPYTELEFQVLQNMWGNQMIIMWKKGMAGTYTVGENPAWVCNPFEAGGWDAQDFTAEEVEAAINKTASALVSVGIKMVP
jgi:hypothetical protein